MVLQWGMYTFALALTGLGVAWRRRDPLLVMGVPLAMAIMHLIWGGAFWVGIVRRPKSWKTR